MEDIDIGKTKKRKLIVDPPNGWMYGFPAEFPEGITYEELLRKHGYPEKGITLAMRYSRYWTEEEQ